MEGSGRPAGRWSFAAPVLAAVVAAGTVLAVGLLAHPEEGVAPVLPEPAALDRTGLSLDRCADALDVAGLAGRYPDRAQWRVDARLAEPDVAVTLVGGGVPFVCATGPTTVEVSDPAATVPVGDVSLLLTTPSGVIAAVAPRGATVAVSVAGAGPPAAARYFLAATRTAIDDPAQLGVGTGTGTAGRAPARLAPPALHVVDRRSVPVDRSAEALALLARCLAAEEADRFWVPAQELVVQRAAGRESLLVVTGAATVGGCVVSSEGVTPIRAWRTGVPTDGPRPFFWLPLPGSSLPGLGPDIAAGSARERVTRMEVTAATGQVWSVAVGGRTFATRLPDGVSPDPRALIVRAFDVEGLLVYEGPAAG